MLIEIKSRYTSDILYSCEAENKKEALEKAVVDGADLTLADMRGANLRFADLRVANLRDANLRFADLRGADLRFADLRGADLRFADLRGADMIGADLSYADMIGANLRQANLSGAKLMGERLVITPISILNLTWAILITAEYLTIGCQRHSHKEWSSFTTKQIAEMAISADDFWKSNKTWLLAACEAHKKEALKVRKGKSNEGLFIHNINFNHSRYIGK